MIDEGVKTVMVVGGTFDPPHKGHVFLPMLARQVMEREMGAAGSVFALYVPAFVSPHKTDHTMTSASHRSEMLRLAVQHLPRTSVWLEEIARGERTGQASFTVQTLERLRSWLDRQGRSDVTLRLVMGADQLAKLHTWREPRRVIALARPAILMRVVQPGAGAMPDLVGILRATGFWDADDAAWLVKGALASGMMPYSSTAIREAVASGHEPQGLDPLVANYIREHGLYR
jgi:nicotinate-nucleotide adenylyltransferase